MGGRHNAGFKKIFSVAAVIERPSMDANCSILVTADHDLIQRDTSGTTIRHTVKSRASLQSSFRIFGDDAKLDVDGDKDLECKLERLQVTTVNREKLMEYIRRGAWKPDVDKLKELKHWPEPSRRIPIFFGERQAP